ncbi:hypothetical protein [Salibacter halophilus]|uniref:Uncharacterized protein n=1 Tax=Salibacter halophilus TaxID=1803916 RepID=A0A6N6M8T0_9FLAO|nr:hypothetical protein [Salibacter halophilus]KAB1064418.1 hypothetical protein F3059_06875 [Salibacter halophilus]
MIKRVFYIFIILAIGALVFSQSFKPVSGSNTQSANDTYSGFVDFPDPLDRKVRLAALRALTHFPDLKNTQIDFVVDNSISNCIMQAQPKMNFLFRSKDERQYKIKIRSIIGWENDTLYLKNFSEKVIEGWFAHELGHVMDYRERSNWDMVKFGTQYVFSESFMKEAEQSADHFAVESGCGHHLVCMKEFILANERLPESYRQKIIDIYPSPSEILELTKAEQEDENIGQNL